MRSADRKTLVSLSNESDSAAVGHHHAGSLTVGEVLPEVAELAHVPGAARTVGFTTGNRLVTPSE